MSLGSNLSLVWGFLSTRKKWWLTPIVVLLFATPGHVWISPGAWGSTVWFAALLAFFAILVLGAARRSDIAIFFIGTHAALLVARALWLGDPLAIPLHQLQSGSLLIFTFFMISDPRTSPDSRLGRFIFAASVAALAHYMAFSSILGASKRGRHVEERIDR